MESLLPLTYWHWLTLGLLLVILEVLSFTATLLWVGAGALVTAAFAFLLPASTWQQQSLCFAIATLSLLAFTRFWLQHRDPQAEHPTLNRRADSLLGQVHALDGAIIGGQGRINIHDTLWQLRGPDLPAGSSVRIIAVDGGTLQVEAVKGPEQR